MQTVWKGSISFGLVSIPVRLVAATEERDVSFRQVHAADGGRIRYKRVCDNGGHEVAYADIAKGYELPGGDIVVLTDDDLADLPITSSKVVEVQAFVPFEDIDPTALSRAYYAEPSADPKPYVLFRDALEKAGRVAIVKVALRNRERLAVLRSREGVLIVQTMLWPDEVRRPDFRFLDDQIGVRPQEMRMAESYIDAMAEEFEPEEYVDEYREALLEVVQAKVDGAEITKAPEAEAEEGKVVDLMDALRRSVAEAKKQRGEAAEAPAKRSAAKTTAKKTAAKKAAPAKKAAAKRKSA
ncbi:MAG: Ku protein [Acidimicrobiales bacterium]